LATLTIAAILNAASRAVMCGPESRIDPVLRRLLGLCIVSCERPASNDTAYPIVLETEDSGAVSGDVPGLPVYAAADSQAKAERAIRAVLAEYLDEHPDTHPGARVRVARVSDRGKARVSVAGVAALVGAKRSGAKAQPSHANGRLGGRPLKNVNKRATRTKASR
jgi:hypothetical protein